VIYRGKMFNIETRRNGDVWGDLIKEEETRNWALQNNHLRAVETHGEYLDGEGTNRLQGWREV